MRIIRGIPAARGIAIGPVYLYTPLAIEIQYCQIEDPAKEWKRLQSAIQTASHELHLAHEQAQEKIGDSEAAIFEAHLEMLDDPELLDLARNMIEDQRINAETAFNNAAETYASAIEAMEDEYFRARGADIRDVKKRVLRILLGLEDNPFASLNTPSIILAQDLTPSDTIALDKSLVLGFCTASGGSTSHTAILARGLGLPAIVGAGNDILAIPGDSQVILDGQSGELTVDAGAATIEKYRQKQLSAIQSQEAAVKKARQPAITRDGKQVEVVANIGSVEEARKAMELGAEGVGLLRTEFLYLREERLPDEEEQYTAYCAILDSFGDYPVVLRTLDIGGDKEIPYLNIPTEMNSFLGLRAIRLCFQRPDLFKPQLRAVLRASAGRNLKLMFPMIATPAEVIKARQILEDCRNELQQEGISTSEKMEIGIMVEIPSAVMLADHFCKYVDFFSIGTNDLTQYTLAVDRTHPALSYLSSAFSPAVLRLVASLIETAHKYGKWVGMCGELAGEPAAIPILLGLGLDEFSMNAPMIPTIKEILRSLSANDCRTVAERALQMSDPEEVKAYIQKEYPITK